MANILADNIFRCVLMNQKFWILNYAKGLIDN